MKNKINIQTHSQKKEFNWTANLKQQEEEQNKSSKIKLKCLAGRKVASGLLKDPEITQHQIKCRNKEKSIVQHQQKVYCHSDEQVNSYLANCKTKDKKTHFLKII